MEGDLFRECAADVLVELQVDSSLTEVRACCGFTITSENVSVGALIDLTGLLPSPRIAPGFDSLTSPSILARAGCNP